MLAVEEKEACFKRGPELTTELYRSESKLTQGCDLEVGKKMYPRISTLMSKKLKIMYIFQKIMYKKRAIPE